MPGPRVRAAMERWNYILTVWPSAHARDRGGWALRLCTGGQPITVTVGAQSCTYLPYLPASTTATDTLSTAPQSFTTSAPVEVLEDLSQGVGELARLYVGDGWNQRIVQVSGDVSAFSWGALLDDVTVTIQDRDISDGGQLWPDGAELDSERFADLANTGDRHIAPEAAGLLPARVYAPVGSAALAPMLCVQDEVDAVSGVSNLGARRYLMGARRPAATGSAHQVYVVHPSREGHFMAGAVAAYQATPAEGTDALGDPYWYLAGDFDESAGNATTVAFVNGSPTVTATETAGKIAVGDQIKGASGGADDYVTVASIEGNTITLSANYGGPTMPAGTADVIRLPPARGYPAYRALTYGGDVFADSGAGTNRPISAVVDVLIDVLRAARLPLDVCLSDIEAMRPRLLGLTLTAILDQRQEPYGWALSRVLDWLPIRPYREGARLRFAWVGPVTDAEIVTEIDLDTIGPAYRLQPISWSGDDPTPIVRVGYLWDVFREEYRSTVTQDGAATLQSGGPRGARMQTGRAIESLLTARRRGSVEREYDSIEDRTVAGIASSWLMYRYGVRAQGSSLEVDGSYDWLRVGNVMRITQTVQVRTSTLWRVEMFQRSALGGGTLTLEAVTS